MLESIRRYLMDRMLIRKEKMEKFDGQFCPKIHQILEKNKLASGGCIPKFCGDNKFQILCQGGDQYVCDLSARSCSCRRWDLTGIPCSHGISAIYLKSWQPEDFVDDVYKKELYMKCYEPLISPLNGPKMWTRTKGVTVFPPLYHKQTGRPKKGRRLEVDEAASKGPKLKKTGSKGKCGKCGAFGHNKRRCDKVQHTQPTQSQQRRGTSTEPSQPTQPTQASQSFHPTQRRATRTQSSSHSVTETTSQSTQPRRKRAAAGPSSYSQRVVQSQPPPSSHSGPSPTRFMWHGKFVLTKGVNADGSPKKN